MPISSAAVTGALPPPDPNRAKVLELQREIHDRLVAQLDLTRIPIERLGDENLWQRAESAICDIVEQLDADGHLPGFVDQDTLIKDALNEALGLGPLEDLLADDEVTDILVNRPDRVIVSRGGRLQPFEKAFSSDGALRQVIDRLIAPSGRRAGDDAPLIDIRLRDGARLTAAIPPLAVRGACLTLRKPRRQMLSLDDLTRAGTLSTNIADFLATCVSARRNIVICGGGGAGKTTLAAALAALFPPGERIVTVEDVAELALGGDQWIALETRPPDGRPICLPSARARATPAMVRSTISSRSKSATPASIVNKSCDTGSRAARISMPCVTATKLTPASVSWRTLESRSNAERPNRSSFHTRTWSILPRRAPSITSCSPGRSLFCPLPVSSMSSTTSRRLWRAAARSSARARVGFWSFVETRWYRAALCLIGMA